MNMPFALFALCTGALWLGACNKTPTAPPTLMVHQSGQPDSGALAGTVANTTVPSAESVLLPANAARPDPALGRSNNAMSAAQESTAMPMPGQNNDHSAPLVPASPASAP
jgi:hypothetical protein